MLKIGLLTHSFNESLLLQQWVDWHQSQVDIGLIIDHHSTDNSIRGLKLPDRWEIHTSKLPNFEAEAVDREMENMELYLKEKYNLDFVLTLNVTEFLWSKDFREDLTQAAQDNPTIQAFGMLSYCIVDPEVNNSTDPLSHTHGFLSDGTQQGIICRHRRYIHNSPNPNIYTPGRHTVNLSSTDLQESYILHYTFAPYPLCRPRKLQIQSRIPDSDRHQSRGVQHFLSESSLTELYNKHLEYTTDLTQDHKYADIYYQKIQEKI